MKICSVIFFVLLSFASTAQNDSAYIKAITGRADKIVAGLGITDAAKSIKVRDIIKQQYSDLNDIYTLRDSGIKKLKASSAGKTEMEAAVKAVQDNADKGVTALHKAFISKLSKYLTPKQIDGVKDGLTYNVLHVTYDGYVDMIPSLTEPQKKQIMDWLIEAREHSMDAESSEKKHAWFGKYKGRINNYLSAAGYDITKERQEWEKRLKARKEARQ